MCSKFRINLRDICIGMLLLFVFKRTQFIPIYKCKYYTNGTLFWFIFELPFWNVPFITILKLKIWHAITLLKFLVWSANEMLFRTISLNKMSLYICRLCSRVLVVHYQPLSMAKRTTNRWQWWYLHHGETLNATKKFIRQDREAVMG